MDFDAYDALNEHVRSETENKKHKNHQDFDACYQARPKQCGPLSVYLSIFNDISCYLS